MKRAKSGAIVHELKDGPMPDSIFPSVYGAYSELTVHPELPFTIKGKDGGDRIVHVMRMGWKYYCSAEYLEKMERENER